MKKFRFTLETVLTYRMHVEDREKQLLMSMQLFYTHEQQRLSDLEARRERVRAELGAREATPFSKAEIDLYSPYLRKLLAAMQSKRKQLGQLQSRIDQQKALVAQSYQRRRILELLKGKQQQAHAQACDKEDQQLVDDLQLAKHSPGKENE